MSSVANNHKRSKPIDALKARRVRTGCLTCRERHLKCDEFKPICHNCNKSRRNCKWGLRISYMPPRLFTPKRIPRFEKWEDFCDESLQIASGYPHGLSNYEQALRTLRLPALQPRLKVETQQAWPTTLRPWQRRQTLSYPHDAVEQTTHQCQQAVTLPPSPPQSAGRLVPSDRALLGSNASRGFDDHYQNQIKLEPAYVGTEQRNPLGTMLPTNVLHVKQEVRSDRSDGSSALSIVPQNTHTPLIANRDPGEGVPREEIRTLAPDDNPPDGEREYLGSPEEMHYMQVFTEEVGIWMDSFDRDKHFSQIIPYDTLKSPMLLNAFLACGVMPLSIMSRELDDKALCYYNTATTHLLRSLQNPDRDTEECAAAAVVLNVYEIMSDSPSNRMKHAAGARALVKECGWNGKSPGIGSACFWLNIEMEVLDCLAMKWQTTWSPEEWGVDMSFDATPGCASSSGEEELWVQRIVFIVAKIANFRAASSDEAGSCLCEDWKLGSNRHVSWTELRKLCLRWNSSCPRTMHPVGYLPASRATSKSLFPNIWLTKRAAILGRLFYHTALCVLGLTNPLEPPDMCEEMQNFSVHHARQLCGVIAHTKDRGISSVAIRCLATTGPALTEYAEQQEVLRILSDLGSRSGWRVNRLKEDLKTTWSWNEKPSVRGPPPAIVRRMVGGNPLSSADFNHPNHPYRNWYQPPNRSNGFTSQYVQVPDV